ncbi:MAG TPA: hypothetical protein VNX68_16270 [Nitrosopumilaceae archaeon]|jgi:hypothetical protein|nr:hypothetical protein [Nitrosopumilaceae archaeon]
MQIDEPKRSKAIISDLDGTLALLGGRDPYKQQSRLMEDIVNEQLLNVIELYLSQGYELLVLTGRDEEHRALTEEWLALANLHPAEMYMRPWGNYDNARILKEWYLENVIQQKYEVVLAFEDLFAIAQMYRKHGIDCWQVQSDPFLKEGIT